MAEIAQMSTADFSCASLAFRNYLDGMQFFLDEMLPRVARAGLRDPA